MTRPNDLAAARGIIVGTCLGVCLWIIICAIILASSAGFGDSPAATEAGGVPATRAPGGGAAR